ncbi:unnamed protein product [Symbiodinium sp. CCMP2592]|nr:unnamed protein product [Symbiodinium sp. CCMP2592]
MVCFTHAWTAGCLLTGWNAGCASGIESGQSEARFVVIAADGSLHHESGSPLESQPLYSSEGSAMSTAVADVNVGSTASARKLSSLSASARTRINVPFVPVFCSSLGL